MARARRARGKVFGPLSIITVGPAVVAITVPVWSSHWYASTGPEAGLTQNFAGAVAVQQLAPAGGPHGPCAHAKTNARKIVFLIPTSRSTPRES
jgi:hypothetical protein